MEDETRRLLTFLGRSIAPFVMCLVGLMQLRWSHLAPKAACDILPPSRWDGARAIVTSLLILLSVAGIAISLPPIQSIGVSLALGVIQHVLEMSAWSFVLFMQLQELRRFIIFRHVLEAFYVIEAFLLIEEVYTIFTQFSEPSLRQAILPQFVLILLQYPCNLFMAAMLFRRVPAPSIENLWWNMETKYRMKPGLSSTSGGLLTKGDADYESSFHAVNADTPDLESSLSRKVKRDLSKALISKAEEDDQFPMPSNLGPLSLFITKWEVAGSDGSKMSDLWGRTSYIVFSIRVKWDKKLIWQVQRRYSDFRLLFYFLQRDGITDKLIFTEPRFPRRGKCSRFCQFMKPQTFEQNSVMRLIKGLNGRIQDILTSPASKVHPLFRAFCAQGRVLRAGERFNDTLSIYDFELISLIGKGSYGKVMQARKKDSGKIYAIKVLKKTDLKKASQIQHTKTERHILEKIVHPFICSLRYAFQDQTKLFMVLDFFTGGELFFHLNKGRFPEERARFYIAEILLALEHLHSRNIVYRDLKPENVLLDSDGHIKLTDFGLSRKFKTGENEAKTFCGTPQYLAPEIILGKGYSFGVDWWAMGALTFELLTRTPPFQERDAKRLYNLILTAPVLYPGYLSPAGKSFCAALLQRNPLNRLGYCGADEIKAHPFFEGIDWKLLREKKLPVPFKPDSHVEQGGLDNVWPEFKSAKVKDTFIEPPSHDALHEERRFSQFSYAQPETYMTYAGSLLGGEIPSSSYRTRPRGLLGSVHLFSGRDKGNDEDGIQMDESDNEAEFTRR